MKTVLIRLAYVPATLVCVIFSPLLWLGAVYLKLFSEYEFDWKTTFAMAIMPTIVCGRYA